MTARNIKGLAAGLGLIGIIVGCSAVFQQGSGGSDPSAGFARVDSDFSDAPVSPGGTGGAVAEDPQLAGEETRSFFKAFQIDPEAEDTAGPKFVVAADINRDGLLDLVSGWNQSQPVQLHLQQRDAQGNLSFRTINLGGTTPIAIIAGVEVGLINDDEWLDIVILSKATGFVTICPDTGEEISPLDGEIIVLFNPGAAGLIPDGDAWREMILVNPFVQDPWIHDQFPGKEEKPVNELRTQPEWGGFTSLLVGEFDGRPGDDIVVALNTGECESLGQMPPINTVDLWVNPGPGLSEIFDQWGAPLPDDPTRRVPVSLMLDAPQVKDLAAMDIDDDGDLDIIASWTNALSQNLRWVRNPMIRNDGQPGGFGAVISGVSDGWRFISTEWERRPIGQVDTGADVIAIGDVDGDGSDDVAVRSTEGRIVQWFRRPNALVVAPEFPPNDPVPDRFNFPWPVFTLTEFPDSDPEAIALGDLNGDGRLELVAAAAGAVLWYDGTIGATVFDPWFPNTIIQDSPPAASAPSSSGQSSGGSSAGAAPAPGSGVGVETVDVSTSINTLLIVDLDGDGRNDVIGTLDRRAGSGLTDDRLVWYRNVRTQDGAEATRPSKSEPRPPTR